MCALISGLTPGGGRRLSPKGSFYGIGFLLGIKLRNVHIECTVLRIVTICCGICLRDGVLSDLFLNSHLFFKKEICCKTDKNKRENFFKVCGGNMLNQPSANLCTNDPTYAE